MKMAEKNTQTMYAGRLTDAGLSNNNTLQEIFPIYRTLYLVFLCSKYFSEYTQYLHSSFLKFLNLVHSETGIYAARISSNLNYLACSF